MFFATGPTCSWRGTCSGIRSRASPRSCSAGRPGRDRTAQGRPGLIQAVGGRGIAPQVVFEVLSPRQPRSEMDQKLEFYDRYGVEEYYIYDPDDIELIGCRRIGDELVEIAEMNGWTSPRLGIRFDSSGSELRIYGPDGRAFLTFAELEQQRKARTGTRQGRTGTRQGRSGTRSGHPGTRPSRTGTTGRTRTHRTTRGSTAVPRSRTGFLIHLLISHCPGSRINTARPCPGKPGPGRRRRRCRRR